MSEETVALRVKELRKYFGSVRAVDGVSFELHEAEILGIVGPNGAGKTTLLNLISGVIKPDSGKVMTRIRGRMVDVTGWPPPKLSSIGIARAFQVPNVFEGLSVLDNLRAAIIARNRLYRSISKPYDGGLAGVDDEAWRLLEFVGLSDKYYVAARSLSHGERKLLDIAIALALNPRILLLDEPTAGLGSQDKDLVVDLIKKFRAEQRKSVIVVEHDLDVVFSVSDRVLVMYDGRVLAIGPPDAVRADPRVRKLYLGEST